MRFDKLRCTAFEELMLAQDSAAYPCNIYVRMTLTGTLDRNHFTEAVRLMLKKHPLLIAKISTRFGRSSWLIPATEQHATTEHETSEYDAVQQIIRWRTDRDDDSMNVPEESRFDLHCEPGLRIDVLELLAGESRTDKNTQSLVAMKLHHAVADGLGINSAIHDMWHAYDRLVKAQALNLPDRKSSLLPTRNRFVPSIAKLLRMIPDQLAGLAGVRQYLTRRPVPLVQHAAPERVPLAPLTFNAVSYQCDQVQTERLRQNAKQRKISLNELLAACVFRGSAEFRSSRLTDVTLPSELQRSEVQATNEWLRMMVPVSLRGSSDAQHLPACNVVSSVFLDRTLKQIEDFDTLVQSVHKEMALIKDKRLALIFIFSIWIRKLTTFRSVNKPIRRCQTSIVFSNLGKIFVKSPLRIGGQRIAPGNVVLESFEIFAPLTRYMNAAFTALIYGEGLKMMLRFDPRFIHADDARMLLGMVVAEFDRLDPAGASSS